MKKFMYIFGILSLALSGVSCNNNDLTDEGDLLPPDAIRPALSGGSEVNNELTVFFDEYLSIIGHSIFDDYHEHWGRVRNEVDSCVMINNAEEFRQIDFINEPLELPAIDFDAYTLVIGQYLAFNSGYNLVSHGVVVGSDEMLMNALIKRAQDHAFEVINMKFFWGLYPKLPQMPIHVVRIND